MEMKILWGHYDYNIGRLGYIGPETLAKPKGDGLVYLVEKISSQQNIQTVAWVLLSAFSQIYL
jgi:hypothetical protein